MKNNDKVTLFKKEFDKKLITKLIISGVIFNIAIILFIITTVFMTIAYNENILESYKLWHLAVVNPADPNYQDDYQPKLDVIRLGPDMYTWKIIALKSTPGNGFWSYPLFIVSIIILAPTMIFISTFFLINFFPVDWDKRREKKLANIKNDTKTKKFNKVGN